MTKSQPINPMNPRNLTLDVKCLDATPFAPSPSPPKIDPCSTKLHSRLNLLLLVLPAIISRPFSRAVRSENHRLTPAAPCRSFIYVSVLMIIGGLFSLSPHASAGTQKDFTGGAGTGTSLLTTTNYNPSGTPTPTVDVRLTSTGTALTDTSNTSLAMESLSVDNAKSYSITNGATASGSDSLLSLGNNAGFTNAFSTVVNDLIYLTGNSNLIISNGPNKTLTLALASSGNFNVGAGSVLNISSIISGSGTGMTMSNLGTVIFGGANTYTGATIVNAGDLRFAASGSSNSSTIRLGNTIADSLAATLSLSNGFGGPSGVNVASPLEVRASASGTQGTRVLRSLATSGTNTYSGPITLNAGLTLESATGGTLLLQGGSVAFGNNTLTIDTQVDLNGANSVNMQGAVTINEALTSSLATGGSLVKDGANTLLIQSTGNTYTGNTSAGVSLNTNGTRIRGGTLAITGDTSLGLAPSVATNNIFFEASTLTSPPSTRTLQASGGSVSLAATRNINVSGGVTGTFDSNGNTFTINGVINGTGGNVAKIGAGSLVLTNANTFTGTTTINAGTVNVSAADALGSTSKITVNSEGTLLLSNNATNNRINDAATMTLNGGTFNTGGLSEHGALNNTAGIGALTLQTSSIIDMSNAASIIAFANSAALAGSWSGTLSIYNWSGVPTTGGGTDQLFFGSSSAGLLPTQLADFRFYSGDGTGAYTPGAIILANGEVVPLNAVPEPSTWAAGALALLAVGYTQRRRFVRMTALVRA